MKQVTKILHERYIVDYLIEESVWFFINKMTNFVPFVYACQDDDHGNSEEASATITTATMTTITVATTAPSENNKHIT